MGNVGGTHTVAGGHEVPCGGSVCGGQNGGSVQIVGWIGPQTVACGGHCVWMAGQTVCGPIIVG